MSIVTITPAARAASQMSRALSSAIYVVKRLPDGRELHRHLGSARKALRLEPPRERPVRVDRGLRGAGVEGVLAKMVERDTESLGGELARDAERVVDRLAGNEAPDHVARHRRRRHDALDLAASGCPEEHVAQRRGGTGRGLPRLAGHRADYVPALRPCDQSAQRGWRRSRKATIPSCASSEAKSRAERSTMRAPSFSMAARMPAVMSRFDSARPCGDPLRRSAVRVAIVAPTFSVAMVTARCAPPRRCRMFRR